MDWIIETIKEEAIAAGMIVLGFVVFFVCFSIGDFFSGIGNWLFGTKEKEDSNDPPS